MDGVAPKACLKLSSCTAWLRMVCCTHSLHNSSIVNHLLLLGMHSTKGLLTQQAKCVTRQLMLATSPQTRLKPAGLCLWHETVYIPSCCMHECDGVQQVCIVHVDSQSICNSGGIQAAKLRLGFLHESGNGVPQDHEVGVGCTA